MMAYLVELGLPLQRMARLTGGLRGWIDSGRPAPPPATSAGTVSGLDALLAEAGVGALAAGITLDALATEMAGGRPALLAYLKESGVSSLADRQKLANALAKAKREGRIATT